MEPSQIYRRDLRRCRYFTREEERELWERMKSGDGSAREALVLSMLPFVVTRAAAYCRQHRYSLADAIENGNVGLLIAVDRFDADKGRLATLACYWIDREIRQGAERDTTIRIPQHVIHPDPKRRGFSDQQRDGWMKLRNRAAELRDDLTTRPSKSSLGSDELAFLNERIEGLTQNQQRVVRSRIDGATFTEIGLRFGVTRQRAQQIWHRAVKALRRSYEIQAGAAQ